MSARFSASYLVSTSGPFMERQGEERASPLSTGSRSRASAELCRLDWAAELSADALAAFEESAEFIAYDAGSVVVEYEAELTHIQFVLSGRLEAELFDLLGKRIQEAAFVRGMVVGLFGISLLERSHVRVVATEPTTAFRMTLPALLKLTAEHSDFQLAVLRLASRLVKRLITVDRSLRRPAVVGIVHHSEAGRLLTRKLASRLRDLDERPCVAGDDPNFRPEGDIPFRLVIQDGRVVDENEKQSILKEWSRHGRLLIDVRVEHPTEQLIGLLHHVEIVLWCVRSADAEQAVRVLRLIAGNAPWVRDKVCIVWLLDAGEEAAPYVPELIALTQRDFKLSFDAPRPTRGGLTRNGFERIVHYLRGVQIGLALGGGAARGMAHLGVLKALEDQGIVIDRLAGTSAGAMTGTIYASGVDPAHGALCFKTDLRPSWFFRRLPGGGYWYLLYKYRRKLFDSMLRKYLERNRLEQLVLPMATIAVDLVDGEALVRESGDATFGILESINLPPLSLPIFRDGQALVDGGLLNNVPADVLVSRGCNFVIASTVTAQLEKDFMGIRSQGRPRLSRFFSTLQVVMRQTMILNRSMNAVGVQPADFVIATDVTDFDISEFTRADEMAVRGEAATLAAIGELRKLLSRLDPKLFPLPS